jgi:hypothetical protein
MLPIDRGASGTVLLAFDEQNCDVVAIAVPVFDHIRRLRAGVGDDGSFFLVVKLRRIVEGHQC